MSKSKTEESKPKYLKGATGEAKEMLDFLLKYVDSHMVEVVADKNSFVAYCKDEDRGDMIFTIDALKPTNAVEAREKVEGNNGDTVNASSEKEE